jgi:hypothetical protein
VIRIDVLPDDVLLEIFYFYVDINSSYGGRKAAEAWQSLVHVCRRWRSLVFRSPRRLNLRLYCTHETPARDTLHVWPALPLIIRCDMTATPTTDNIIAALGQSNYIFQVHLWIYTDRQLEEVLPAMQVPFPELTDLRLLSFGETMPVTGIPDSFLGGSAPRLRMFILDGFPFPGLPKLLLSASHLVYLRLFNIPHSGYISPEAVVALLSVLSSLEGLSLHFQSSRSRPDRESRRPPPSKRSVIPALTSFHFKGAIEYLEDLVIAIDSPQLDDMQITFFNQIDIDTPRLAQFINRTPNLTKRDAYVLFDKDFAVVKLSPGTLRIIILCEEPRWQLSSIKQVCNSSLHPLSTVEDLSITHQSWKLVWKNDAIENTLWLQFLLPFTAVKNLYLYREFAPGIAATLQDLVGGRIMEVLPSLQNIFVEWLEPLGPFQEKIGQFVAARQLLDHPITVSVWDSNVRPMPSRIS